MGGAIEQMRARAASGVAQLGVEQLDRHAEREVALELVAARVQHAHPRLLRDRGGAQEEP